MHNTALDSIPLLIHDEPVTDNEIVPDNLQALLCSVRDDLKRDYFAVGDVASKLIQSAEAQGFRVRRLSGRDVFVSQDRVFQAIGNFIGKSGRTVRDYYEISSFFPHGLCHVCNTPMEDPPDKYSDICQKEHWCAHCGCARMDVREEFDSLNFAMFRLAKTFRERWRDVLEYAAVNPALDSESVRRAFIAEAAGEACESVKGDDEPGEIPPARATDVVGGLSRLLEALSGFLKRVRLSPELQQRAMLCVGEFRNLLTEIAAEMRERST